MHADTCVCVPVRVCMWQFNLNWKTSREGKRDGAEDSETEVDRKRLLMGSFKLKRIRPWMWESNSLQSNGIGIEQGK